MTTLNPFRYGTIVEGSYFIDRENEIKEIKNNLYSGQNLIIYSPRRYGKTSVMAKVLKELHEEDYFIVYIDLFRITSQKKFIESYSREILKNQPHFKKVITKFQSFVKGISPAVSFDNQGNPLFSISFHPGVSLTDSLTEILDLPEKLVQNKKWIIVYDEFQEIEKLNGENFEKLMRSVIQFHNMTRYVFMGSKSHLLLNMFNRKNRAFYKFGKLMKINKINEKDFQEYISSRFTEAGFNYMNDLPEKIVRITNNIPYYVQFLASEVWNEGLNNNRRIRDQELDNAIDKILTNQQDYYIEIFDKLSLYQKKVLQALIQSREKIFSEEYRVIHDLGATSSTQRALERLVQLEIVEKNGSRIEFTDPFFPVFIQRNFS
jgi:AAA+ ATPase superfamily predicted ATPase